MGAQINRQIQLRVKGWLKGGDAETLIWNNSKGRVESLIQ